MRFGAAIPIWAGERTLWAASLACAMLCSACEQSADEQAKSQPSIDRSAAVDSAGSSKIAQKKIEEALDSAHQYLNVQDDPAKAQAILITLIDKAPREVRARELYGQSFVVLAMQADQRRDAAVAQECRKKAYEQYKVAVELDPASAGLHHSAGQMAILAGENAAALEHFQAAGRLDPTNPQYPLFAAQILIQAKRFDEARAMLDDVLRLDPDEAIAHASLAMIALEQNHFDEALKHMADARQLQPADLGLRSQQAKIHRRQGNPKRALELLIGLSEQQRAQEMVAYEIAASFDLLGEHMKAARAWQLCYVANERGPRAWLFAVRTGEQLVKAGERDQAAAWLRQAQITAGDAPEVQALEAAMKRQ